VDKGFKEAWLSDPSTYPIIFIMGFALTFMTGMSLHALAYYKDVRIDPSKRNSEVRTWGNERVSSVTSVLGDKNPYYKAMLTEGLGVNHEEWIKAKAAKDQA
jgi:NADH-ubiquinone reductase complex 1 MLRQ subunit